MVVADDEEPYRKALQQVLLSIPDIELVGIARDGIEATQLVEEKDADILLTDIEMPRMDGIECIWHLVKRKHDVVPVILTVHEEDDHVFQAIRAGALGYLLKTSTAEEVVTAIRRAHKGEATLTPKIAAMVLEEFRRLHADGNLPDEHLYELSKREIEILELIVKGMRNKEIAEHLHLAEKTVKNHVSNILKSLHVNSRTEAAMKAVREKLV